MKTSGHGLDRDFTAKSLVKAPQPPRYMMHTSLSVCDYCRPSNDLNQSVGQSVNQYNEMSCVVANDGIGTVLAYDNSARDFISR